MSFGFGFSLPTLGWHLSGGGASSGYSVTNSLRFRSSASAYLNRTPAVAGNRTTWTWSGWVKRGTLSTGTVQRIFSVDSSPSGAPSGIWFNGTTDTLNVVFTNDTGINYTGATTTAVFRDPAAWYHVTAACDTTQATNTNRIRIYINGVIQTTVVFSTGYPSLNDTGLINLNRLTLIGQYASVQFFDGELAEVNFVDGYPTGVTSGTWAATNVATIFGAFSTYNQWLPIRYAGTYGTNGFYLPFSGGTATSYAGSFNGSNQYLTVANTALLEPSAAQAWTLETWINPTTVAVDGQIYQYSPLVISTGNDFGIYAVIVGGILYAGFYSGATQYQVLSSATVAINTWTHIAVVSTGSVLTLYVNGVSVSSVSASAAPNATASFFAKIGYLHAPTPRYFPGQISNFRFVKGTAVYTANFTPPIVPLTAITNTSLLTLQSATVVDNSGNSLAITNNGTVVTSVQSPFLNTTVLAADSSGNANNWTPNNISLTAGSTYDSLTDVPTLTSATVANYAVLNPNANKFGVTIADVNLTTTFYPASAGGPSSTIGVSSGKWYFEFKPTVNIGASAAMGVGIVNTPWLASGGWYDVGNQSYVYYWNASAIGGAYANGTFTSYSAPLTTSDIGGVAFDLTASTVSFYKNNVLVITVSIPSGQTWFATSGSGSSAAQSYGAYFNFGQRPFTYTPPTGFLALNTYNI